VGLQLGAHGKASTSLWLGGLNRPANSANAAG
jgi:hypothetical protein